MRFFRKNLKLFFTFFTIFTSFFVFSLDLESLMETSCHSKCSGFKICVNCGRTYNYYGTHKTMKKAETACSKCECCKYVFFSYDRKKQKKINKKTHHGHINDPLINDAIKVFHQISYRKSEKMKKKFIFICMEDGCNQCFLQDLQRVTIFGSSYENPENECECTHKKFVRIFPFPLKLQGKIFKDKDYFYLSPFDVWVSSLR